MDADEFARSEDFANSQILPRIHQDWLTNDAALLTEWLQRSERYRPPVSVAEQWHAMYTEALAKVQQEEEGVREVGKRRIMQVWLCRIQMDCPVRPLTRAKDEGSFLIVQPWSPVYSVVLPGA
jgi:hypothetical protein